MNTEVYLVTAGIGFVGTIGGLAIGYYKSKAELPALVDQRVKEQCETCGLKKEVSDMGEDMKEVCQDLKRGSDIFHSIKIDMAVIKTKLGIRCDIDELRKAVEALNSEGGNHG